MPAAAHGLAGVGVVSALVALLVAAPTHGTPAAHAMSRHPSTNSVQTVRTGKTRTASVLPQLGAYAGPGSTGVTGAATFSAFSGSKVSRVLDFLNHSSWLEMTRNGWLLNAYTGKAYQLELSVGMLPDTTGVSLEQCATGAYDGYWKSIGVSLVEAKLPTTAVRPGWEFNGTWYKWTAVGKTQAYIGCFRHVVSTMRAVPGSAFTFVWNPNLGSAPMPTEQAWPGDAYVDRVGVDVYDTSWTWYPTPVGVTATQAQTNAWNWILKGDHGLTFWSAFAATHNKMLELSEWGITWRSDGHGGNDDPAFVDRIFDYISNPANRVVAADYFNSADAAQSRHRLTGATTFPASAARFAAHARVMAPR